MHRFAPVALATILAATAPALLCAQAPTPFTVPAATGKFTDPANLAGERVRPRTGRELPIDGGIGANGQPDNALALAQLLRKLSTRASLMLIVAHPDDEDGGMLTYYSRGLGARVAILTLNRGEGGQNQMTGDFDDALGLLRTQELLSADRYMGVDTQMFGTEVDFGFTKTKQEAFQKWNHQRVLYDAVRAVRIFRPLIIASTFEGAVTDGHGQHQVSGEIAQEVFKAAGDPNVFPELTKEGILPWQPLKVFARVPFSRVSAQGLYDYATGQTVPAEFTNYVTGQTFTTEPTTDVTINEGAPDPLLTTCSANPADLPASLRPAVALGGPAPLSSRPSFLLSSFAAGGGSAFPSTNCTPLSYVQFARIGLGLQRSQIGGGMRLPRPGRVDASYHLYGSRVCAPNLPNPTPNLCHPERSASTNSNAVILSDRSAAKGVEEPRESSPSENSSTIFNPELSHAPSFFDGIDTTWAGIASLDPDDIDPVKMVEIERHAQNAAAAYPAHPDLIAPELATTLKYLYEEIEFINSRPHPTPARANILHELRVKSAQLNDALTLALGASLDATTETARVIQGSTEKATLHITANTNVRPLSAAILGWGGSADGHLSGTHDLRRPSSIDVPITIPARMTQEITRPYFYRDNIEQPVYSLRIEALRNAPESITPFVAWARYDFNGATFQVGRVVHSGPQPVQIIPPVSLLLDRNAQVIPNGAHSLSIDVHTVSEDHPQGELRLHAPQDWTIRSPQRPLRAGTETFAASLPAHPQTATLKAEAIVSGTTYIEGFRAIGYGSLPRTNYYTPATLRVVPVDLKLPPENKRRIAYLPGTGDDVPAALASIGLTPTMLKVSDLTAANLAKYDTVILGVRTYNAHPDLHGAPTQALLDFARNGGNVVVQTQTPEFGAADAPYPLSDRNERVIDETAPVVLLTTANSKLKTDSQTESAEALLTTPNKITSADFNGWIEERGHGFLDTWDPHYTALTETHDPGAPAEHIRPQDPQRGGLITVQLGKGRWTYCAFALYRQLPEAVPGAFRLFVNLLNP